MSDLLQRIQSAEAEALAAFAAATDEAALYQEQVRFLGRKGSFTQILRGLGGLDPEQRKAAGRASNEAKVRLEAALDARREELARGAILAALEKDRLDPTQPGAQRVRGHQHPVLGLQRDLAVLFESMGFTVVDGPEVESEYFNFEALNIPSWHPARDMQDTIWVEGGTVLRTHTSGMQIRAMRELGAPLRVVGIGRVFRHEDQDASHEHTFSQIEGLLVDEGIGLCHLRGVLDALLRGIFGGPVVSRLRPFYFPFVEPGLELDFQCRICGGDGALEGGRSCASCKGTGWIELLGCGMVHPRVLEAGNVDPERFSGFAFGMGIERLAMMRHGIADIRHFLSGDLRFLEQF